MCRPIHQASYHGQKATVELLVKHGAQPNVPNDIESAPLHFAAVRHTLMTDVSVDFIHPAHKY
jgi:ankyrin repeat protein